MTSPAKSTNGLNHQPKPDLSGTKSLNLDKLWMAMEQDYEFVKVLGKGSFGEVIKAKHRVNQNVVAIKLLKDLFKDDYASKKVLSEIQILRQLSVMKSNVFTSKLLDVVTPNVMAGDTFDHLFIVMDCSASDLKKVLSSAT